MGVAVGVLETPVPIVDLLSDAGVQRQATMFVSLCQLQGPCIF